MATRLILTGEVQGVFCREYCSTYARKLELHGSASNMPDGTVEVLLEHEDDEVIYQYKEMLRKNPDGSRFFGKITGISQTSSDKPVTGGDYTF